MNKIIIIFLFLSFCLIGCDRSQTTKELQKQKNNIDTNDRKTDYSNIKKVGCAFGLDDKNVYLLTLLTEEDRWLHADGPDGPHYFYNDKDIERGFVLNKIIPDVSPQFFTIILENEKNCYATDNKLTLYYEPSYPYVYVLKMADAKTFRVLNTSIFSKDKNHVFFYHQNVDGADPDLFEILYDDEYAAYAKDNIGVYFFNKTNKTISHLSQADSGTFILIPQESNRKSPGRPYAKDKNNIYYRDIMIENADMASFEIVQREYSKDNNNVYCDGEIVKDVDLATFTYKPMYDSFQFKDKNRIYPSFCKP